MSRTLTSGDGFARTTRRALPVARQADHPLSVTTHAQVIPEVSACAQRANAHQTPSGRPQGACRTSTQTTTHHPAAHGRYLVSVPRAGMHQRRSHPDTGAGELDRAHRPLGADAESSLQPEQPRLETSLVDSVHPQSGRMPRVLDPVAVHPRRVLARRERQITRSSQDGPHDSLPTCQSHHDFRPAVGCSDHTNLRFPLRIPDRT
jgi:hypothetical protein